MLKRTTATLTAKGEQVNYQENIGDVEAKATILAELYTTGCIAGKFFDRNATGRNPIKTYIAGCLYKSRLINCTDLVDDCYNETFKYLAEMSAGKFMSLYRESPRKVIATALTICSLKCFAVDPRYGNPKHSLIQSIGFASSILGNNMVDPCDYISMVHASEVTTYDNMLVCQSAMTLSSVQIDASNDPTDFERSYGLTVEELIARLTPEEQATFYGMVDPQPRGKVSNAKLQARADLCAKLKAIRLTLKTN